MIKITSLSGGKSSSYMAVNYPTDYYIFALVRINDKKSMPKDKELIKRVSDKIGMDFIATAEADETLKIILDLEQLIGKNIHWVTSDFSFDELIQQRKALPNRAMRFCTTELKMYPIFNWWFQNVGKISLMNIGFRYDEKDRADNIQETIKYNKEYVLKGKYKNRWDLITWRVCDFPLIDNKINHKDVINYWKSKNWKFPISSNCVGCFHKSGNELYHNWNKYHNKMSWFSRQEIRTGNTFKKDISYNDLKNKMNNNLFQDTDFCNSGFCGI